MSWHAAESFDPWAPLSDVDVQDNELDLMDSLDDESAPATP